MSDSAVVKAERRWVANTLENYEVLHALNIIYSRVYECCKSLGDLLSNPLGDDVTTPSSFDSLRNEKRHVTYLRLNDYSTSTVSFTSEKYDEKMIPDEDKKKIDLIGGPDSINCLDDIVDRLSKLVQMNFERDGYVVQTLFLIRKDYRVMNIISTSFDDQADKYIFWRVAADRAKMMGAFGLVWASELWLRETNINFKGAVDKMPIIGERLQVVGIDAKNNQKTINWKIIRENEDSQPSLELLESNEYNEGRGYYMRPVLKAIGADISMLNS